MKNLLLLLLLAQLTFAQKQQPWMIGPFRKADAANPILEAKATTTFKCPLRGETVNWEEKDVFNPAVVVRNGKVYMIYRAEDKVGKYAGTSRLGLATSNDGIHFKRMPEPVFYPDNDFMKKYEWEGGCEDPRIVETEDGRYVMTYTAYDGDLARLCVASSSDLIHWQKHGLAFNSFIKGKRDFWSKSGAIVCRKVGNKFIAAKINGKYWMYWGDQAQLYIATSDDLINWYPATRPNDPAYKSLDVSDVNCIPVATTRNGKHDSRLLESGPPAFLTKDGIVLIYNGMNYNQTGDASLAEGTYAAGQFLFDAENPVQLKDRSENYFLKPDKPYEIVGQVNQVCFVEGLASFKGKWFLYYGTADSKIGVAVAKKINE
ncbi:glycoside hydrolase family 130 protein [Runella sp.]|uniref:glycoside hydrolase family 130 protein n=1 Tax=Runella sp. TaxID=1960881 RepID=UPI0026272D17|nr:glycoside hydrolase family 130 protein [Runella sp.]